MNTKQDNPSTIKETMHMVSCPFCGAEPLPREEQPEPSLHAFTTIYECGSEMVSTLGQTDGVYIQKACDE